MDFQIAQEEVGTSLYVGLNFMLICHQCLKFNKIKTKIIFFFQKK